MSTLENRIKAVRGRIGEACTRSGRKPEDVKLAAVSKTVSAETLSEAFGFGISIFGENRVQEAAEKIPQVCSGPEWHLIGHLQSNKVKRALALFSLIHSVDSFSLLQTLQREAAKNDAILRVLLEVNISGEESKYGFKPEDVAAAIREAASFENIRLGGLMTMAPFFSDPEEARPVFRKLRQLFDRLSDTEPVGSHWRELSMGMSHDFEVAVEEGATIVRVGSAVFKG